MKNFLLATAAAIALFAAPAFSGPTENITGCATVPVDGTNYTVRADVYCAMPVTQGGDSIFKQVATQVFVEVATADDE